MFNKTLACTALLACGLLTSANAFADDAEWQPVSNTTESLDQDYSKGARVSAELAAGVLASAPALGIGSVLSYVSDSDGSALGRRDKLFLIGAAITPFATGGLVHWAGSAMGNQGKGWTAYAGGFLGGVIGGGIGAVGFLDKTSTACMTIWGGAAIGAIIGAITWYEVSDNQAREQAAISNVRPLIEVSDKYTALGVGFDF